MSKNINNNSLFSLILWETTGSSMMGILLWLFGVSSSTYILVPCLAIPFAMIIENIGNPLFYIVRKKSVLFNLKEIKPKPKKNENALFVINTSRSFFIFSILMLIILPFSKSNHEILLYALTTINAISMLLIYFRFEYYFRLSMYKKKEPKK